MKKALTSLSLAATLALASPGFAQDAESKAQKAAQATRAVIGTVKDSRDIELTGVQSKHRLLKIQNKQGKNMVINIGDATKTPKGSLKKGDRIVAVGKAARINGKPILFAKYVGELSEAGHVGAVNGKTGSN